MKVIRCAVGHYFDSDLFESCPHCNTPEKKKAEESAGTRRRNFGLFGRRLPAPGEMKEIEPANPEEKDVDPCSFPSVPVTVCEPTEILSGKEIERLLKEIDEKKRNESSETCDSDCVSGTGEQCRAEERRVTEMPRDTDSPRETESLRETESPRETEKTCYTEKRCGTEEVSATEYTGDPLPALCPAEGSAGPVRREQAAQTEWIAYGRLLTGRRPVAGWLVGIDGPCFGRSFEILQGRNSVGRGRINDIVISDDKRVSRERHMTVVYDPEGHGYYIEPGDSSGLVYCNGRIILAPTAVEGSDLIEIGGGKYMIQPLCGDCFSWHAEPAGQH
ncbi:MAG: FHA domain-containing protein [Clostridia bacterium]|nr:FHA domain-containing protein [Clostridia bacterium]